MLKVDRENRTFGRLEAPTLADARILERADLQECIYNSSSEFFAEIGERVFVLGKEVIPSQTVPDRIDLLGIDTEGTTVIVELKRGSNKLQMLQAVSYAGMLSRWDVDDFRRLVSVGISHDRQVQGLDRARSTEILPWSHTIFSNLKAWLLGTFRGVSKKHMPRYLDEFVYRFNRRWRESELFGFALRRAVCRDPFPYSRLTAELFG